MTEDTTKYDWLNQPPILAHLTHPANGWSSNAENARKYLKSGEWYEVRRIDMGQSSTSVRLKNVSGVFSSVQFDFYDMDKKPIDIFKMPEFNPYLMEDY